MSEDDSAVVGLPKVHSPQYKARMLRVLGAIEKADLMKTASQHPLLERLVERVGVGRTRRFAYLGC